ncbi:hypothetical protein EV356DRAFT_77263 [Viridothelium virens]|uniref:MARVEL domain-containing protein n=1 Tax=Viridothelium virens TaxID=1048519 RepID=A0A6A6HFG2_VIRVR|nr:hypothetical protein EV356DRAFT_77263 [Viridothelium virens]
MDSSRAHIPLHPSWFITFRIIQLVLTVIVLALSAYGLAQSWLTWVALCIAIFTCAVGLPVLIWELVAMTATPRAYNYWAVLAFDIFLVIFWLISWPWVAALAGDIAAATTYTGTYTYDYVKRDYYFYSDGYVSSTYWAILAVNAAAGAVNWVMYVVTLVLTSIYVYRHRQAGGHNRPTSTSALEGGAAPTYVAAGPTPEKYGPPEAMIPTNEVPPQQGYAPSPVHTQAQSDQYPTYAGTRNA